jgi:hypothetical protein
MVSVLAIRRKVRGFKPDRGRWIFNDDNEGKKFNWSEVVRFTAC